MEQKVEYVTDREEELKVRDARTEKRFFVDNVIVSGYGPQIGVYGIAVYAALCMHSKPSTQRCWPSHRTIAKEIGCSVAKVKEALSQLKKLKLLSVDPHYDAENQRQTSNTYTLLDPQAIAETPATTDTPPRYNEKAGMNNPNVIEESQEESPAAPEPSLADDLWNAEVAALGEEEGIAEIEAMFNRTGSKKLSKEEFEKRHNGTAVVAGKEVRGSHDIPGQPWCNRPVEEWCKLAGKSYAEMSVPTRIKLGGIFYKIGTITDSTALEVAEAIGNFKAEHPWWEYDFDWPTDGFCNRLGMMLVPDASAGPQRLDGGEVVRNVEASGYRKVPTRGAIR
jgi:hypothetical protein